MIKEINTRHLFLPLSIIVVYIYFYYLCHIFPFCSDDYAYSYVVGSSERVNALMDIVNSQVNHYFSWGGRVFATTLAQVFLLIGKDFFNLANAICYILTAFMICRLSGVKGIVAFILVAASFWLMMPSPGSSLIWLTGSCNYLWSGAVSLLFLLSVTSDRKVAKYLALLSALFAGNCHEAISVGVFSALLCLLILDKDKRRDALFISAMLVFLLGLVANVFAPGTFVRLSTFNACNCGLLERFGDLYLCASVLKAHLLCADELALCFVGFPVAVSAVLYSWVKKLPCFRLCTALFVGSIAAAMLPMLSNAIYSRALYGAAFLNYLCVCTAILPAISKLSHVTISILLYVVVIINYMQYQEAVDQIKMIAEKELYILNAAEKSNLVFLPKKYCHLGGRYTETYGHFHNGTMNRRFSDYVGQGLVSVFEDQEEINMMMELDPDNPRGTLQRFGYMLLPLDRKPRRVKAVAHPVELPQEGWLRKSMEKRLTVSQDPIVFEREQKYYVLLSEKHETDCIQVIYDDGSSTCIEPIK